MYHVIYNRKEYGDKLLIIYKDVSLDNANIISNNDVNSFYINNSYTKNFY